MLRTFGRICYGLAATSGILGLSMQLNQRASRRNLRGGLAQTGVIITLWAPLLAIAGKILEDLDQEQFVGLPPSYRKLRQNLPLGFERQANQQDDEPLKSAFERPNATMDALHSVGVPSR